MTEKTDTKPEATKAAEPNKRVIEVSRKGNIETTKLPNGTVIVNALSEDA